MVDMDDGSQMPALAEPWFLAFNASVEVLPVMTPEDMGRGGPARPSKTRSRSTASRQPMSAQRALTSWNGVKRRGGANRPMRIKLKGHVPERTDHKSWNHRRTPLLTEEGTQGRLVSRRDNPL